MAALCGAVAASVLTAANARADAPDAVWTALKEREVEVDATGGEVRGKLIGVDAKTVVVLKADGAPVTIARSTVKAVRAIVSDATAPASTASALAATPPLPTAASATVQPPPAAAPPTPATGHAADSPDRPHPELEAMVGGMVLLWLTNRDHVVGRLTETSPEIVVLQTGRRSISIQRDRIASAERTVQSSDWRGSTPDGVPEEPPEENDRPAESDAPGQHGREVPEADPGTRGVWVSSDFSVLNFQHSWLGNRLASVTVTTFGPTAAPFNLGIGGQVSENFLLGARFGFQVLSIEGQDVGVSGRFVARFEIPFGTGTKRGFLAMEPGFAALQQGDSTSGAFVGAISGGARLFAARGFSIDPYGELGYVRQLDMDVNAVYGRVGLMFSGWSWKP